MVHNRGVSTGVDEQEIIMALFWGRKTHDLYKYIMLQAGSKEVWSFTENRALHVSGVRVWMGSGWPFVDIYDPDKLPSKQSVGFSIVQKWRIHRKLKKLHQKILKEERQRELKSRLGNFDSKEEMYLAKMVAGALTGGEVDG